MRGGASWETGVPAGLAPQPPSSRKERTTEMPEYSEAMGKPELQKLAADRGLATSGTKAELVQRLEAHRAAREPQAGGDLDPDGTLADILAEDQLPIDPAPADASPPSQEEPTASQSDQEPAADPAEADKPAQAPPPQPNVVQLFPVGEGILSNEDHQRCLRHVRESLEQAGRRVVMVSREGWANVGGVRHARYRAIVR